jgi:TetR/AcrR family transcriptional regulator, cholesterol catabolism regulator
VHFTRGHVEDRAIRIKDSSLVQARQAQIVEAARRVFREKGFHPATVREIGARAGLTQGTLYNYARSKDDILFLVLDELVREYQEAVREAIAREPDPRKRVRAAIRAFTEVVSERQDDILLIYQEGHALDRPLRRKLLARTHEFFAEAGSIVEKAVDAGVITTPNAYFATQVITFLPALIALRRWDLRDRLAAGDVVEWVVDFIMRGLEYESEADVPAPKLARPKLARHKRARPKPARLKPPQPSLARPDRRPDR